MFDPMAGVQFQMFNLGPRGIGQGVQFSCFNLFLTLRCDKIYTVWLVFAHGHMLSAKIFVFERF